MKKVSLFFPQSCRLFLPILTLTLTLGCNKSDTEQIPDTFPLITSIRPSQGIPGDTISIEGSDFATTLIGMDVKFNGTSSTLASTSQTVIKAIVPTGASTGKVTLMIGTKTGSSSNDFTVLSYVSTVAGNGISNYIEGYGTQAGFADPTDLVLDTSGNIYVADAANFRIRKITPQGLVTTLAGSGRDELVDGNGTSASFGIVLGLGIDKQNKFLYVADLGNHAIRKVSLSGNVTTVAGHGRNSQPGHQDGPVNTARFLLPMGVAVDDLGNIYVADAGNQCIRMISVSGMVSTIAGDRVRGNRNGRGVDARFDLPMKIKINDSGDLIVLESGNNSVRLITKAGMVSTLAGTGVGGYTEGAANMAQFSNPAGLCLDKAGNIYIGDQTNNRIRKISPSGIVSTIAGTGVRGHSNGPATSATFNYPCGIEITPSGTIYLADNSNQLIRRIVQ